MSTEDRGYSLRDVCARLEIPPRRVIDWVEKAVVRPDMADTSGSGTPRLYSETNLLEFAVARELVAVGITVRRVSELLQLLRRETRAHQRALWAEFGTLRFARMLDGSVKYAGSSPPGEDPWKFYGSEVASLGRSFADGVVWMIIDLDSVRAKMQMAVRGGRREGHRSGARRR